MELEIQYTPVIGDFRYTSNEGRPIHLVMKHIRYTPVMGISRQESFLFKGGRHPIKSKGNFRYKYLHQISSVPHFESRLRARYIFSYHGFAVTSPRCMLITQRVYVFRFQRYHIKKKFYTYILDSFCMHHHCTAVSI